MLCATRVHDNDNTLLRVESEGARNAAVSLIEPHVQVSLPSPELFLSCDFERETPFIKRHAQSPSVQLKIAD